MELTVIENKKELLVKFKSPLKSEFFDMLEKIKSLNGRVYISTLKHWKVPNIDINREKLKKWGFNIKYKIKKKKEEKEEKEETEDIKKYLQKELFNYQKEGVQFLFDKKGRGLIGDEMGTGKTLQTIEYIRFKKNLKRILIVCPAVVKLNWGEKEIPKWINEQAIIITGNIEKRKKLYKKYKEEKIRILIINYELLIKDKEIINAL